MGFNYLKDQSWAEVTRDERFFCAHLYRLAQNNGIEDFVGFLKDKLNLDLDPKANWELGYEVCFFRDFCLKFGCEKDYSKKRTFDLCLFSDDTIVIIEAKAQQGFDTKQLKQFKQDVEHIYDMKDKELQGIKHVYICALISNIYHPKEDTKKVFNDNILKWDDIAKHYNDDSILQRANDIYRK